MTPERTLTLDDIYDRTSLRPAQQQALVFAQASLMAAAAAAVAALGMIVGTGGIANEAAVAHVRTGSSPSLRWGHLGRGREGRDDEDAQFLDVSERATQIRHYLSLNTTELAAVLRVERPTVYAWLADRARPQTTNLERLGRLHRLARAWRALSARPLGDLVREPLDGGRLLVERLSEEDWNEREVRALFPSLKRRVDEAQEARRSRRKGGVAEAARRHGFPELPRRAGQRAFDEETSL